MMAEDLNLVKKELRRMALKKRRAMSHEARNAESHRISDRLCELDLYKHASCIFCYVSVEDEVHTLELMNRMLSDGKRLCIPYITEPDSRIMTAALVNNLDDLVPGFWDIPTVRQDKYHEVKPDDIDMVIVPGAAFDKQGHRIGMGGGYYDVFLPKVRNGALVAVAYGCQLMDSIEVMDHDISVDYLLTYNGIIKCSK
jgi:5-formyltetrahydrofolate cyclo-ligase